MNDQFQLQACDNCIQMTNHLDGICQKCKPKDTLKTIQEIERNTIIQQQSNIKVGTILLAKDVCCMRETNKNALVIGKEYVVKNTTSNRGFKIDSLASKDHIFAWHDTDKTSDHSDCWCTYFNLKQQEEDTGLIDYNRRCAEFLGFKKPIFLAGSIPDDTMICDIKGSKGHYRISEMLFNKDWNWLMEVIRKLDKLTEECSSEYEKLSDELDETITRNYDIIEVANVVDKFLIWYFKKAQ